MTPDFDVFPIVAHKNGNGISRLEILMEESASHPEMSGFCPEKNGFCSEKNGFCPGVHLQRLPDIGSYLKV